MNRAATLKVFGAIKDANHELCNIMLHGLKVFGAIKDAFPSVTHNSMKADYEKFGDVGDIAHKAQVSTKRLFKPAALTINGVYGAKWVEREYALA